MLIALQQRSRLGLNPRRTLVTDGHMLKLPAKPESQDPYFILSTLQNMPLHERIVRLVESAVPAVTLLGAGAASGDVALISAGLTATGLFALKESIEEHKQRTGKDPEWDKIDIEAAFRLSGKAGVRGDILGDGYKRLLRKAIDAEHSHSIRIEDMQLMDSLNPADFALLLMMGTQSAEMTKTLGNYVQDLKEHHIHRPCIAAAKNYINSSVFTFKTLRSQWNAVIGNPLAVSDDELLYALKVRSQYRKGSGDLFYVWFFTEDSSITGPDSGEVDLKDNNYFKELEGIHCAVLTAGAARLVRLMVPHTTK